MQTSDFIRKLATGLLLSSVVTIWLVPSANSQQLTTVTSFVTTSFPQTATYYATVTQSGTGTLTETASFTAAGTCYPSLNLVNATGEMQLSYSVSGAVTMYVLNWGSVEQWTAELTEPSGLGFICSPPSWIYIQPLTGTGTLNLNMPSDGNPYMIFLDGQEPNLSATLTICPALMEQTVTSITSGPETVATTLTQTTISQVPFMQTSGAWIVPTIMAIVILAVVWIVVARKPSDKRKSSLRKLQESKSTRTTG